MLLAPHVASSVETATLVATADIADATAAGSVVVDTVVALTAWSGSACNKDEVHIVMSGVSSF
jgi:hypothetical protein